MLWFVFRSPLTPQYSKTLPIAPQAPTARPARSPPTPALLDTTARRPHQPRSRVLPAGSVPVPRLRPPHARTACIPRPSFKPPSPPASPARRARWAGSKRRSATPPRTACAPTAPTSRCGPRSSRPMLPAPGCATAGTMATPARRARLASGASRVLRTAAPPTVLRQRSPRFRTHACATPATRRRAPPRARAPAPCARPGPCAQGQGSCRWRSRPHPSPTSPPSSCSCSSRCRWRTIWCRCL